MKRSQEAGLRGLAILVGVVLAAPGIHAQTAQQGFMLEDILVTARKREENLQETPVAVSAFTANELRYRQVRSTDELGEVTPNLTFDQASPSSGSSSAAQIFIRGVGQTDFTPVTDPGVGLYVDGVYMARSPGNVMDFVDIERVEVLRGPQGTLFGRNTIGGAIVVYTKRPTTDEFYGSVRGRVGEDELFNATGQANLPISDTLAVNGAFDFIQRDGYVKRRNDGTDTGDRDRWAVRGSSLWNLTDNLSAYLTLDYTKIDENGPPTVSGGVNDAQAFGTFGNGLLASCTTISINPDFGVMGPPSFPPPGTGSGTPTPDGCFGPTNIAGKFTSEGTYPVKSELKTYGLGLELEWAINDWLTIKSLTSYREMNMDTSRDGDNTPMNTFATQDDFDHEQTSQELQFINNFMDGAIQSLTGFYYFQENGDNINPVTLPVGALQSGGHYDNDSWAVFAQATWNATDKLAFTGGIRYTEDNKNYTPDQFALGDSSQGPEPNFFGPTWPNFVGFYLQPAPLPPLAAGELILLYRESSENFSETTYLADVKYNWTDNFMTYFRYATGYKSGGFDQRYAGQTPDLLPSTYDPETTDTYEIGLKSEFFENTLRLNLAAFHTDYDDLQIIVRETFNPITFNAGQADIDGGELELTWIPTDALLVNGSVGYIDASYDKVSQEAQATGVLKSNDLVNTPKWSAALGVAYTVFLGSRGKLTPRVDWSYHDSQYNDAINTPQLKQDSYNLVNASLAWDSPNETWEVIGGVRNLGDENYLITGNSAFVTSASYVEKVYGRPREWWASVTWHF
jgi:iron complex outermembrane receptor protein